MIGDAIKDEQARAEKALETLSERITGVKSVSFFIGICAPNARPVFERAVPFAAQPTPIFKSKSQQQVSMSATVIFLID